MRHSLPWAPVPAAHPPQGFMTGTRSRSRAAQDLCCKAIAKSSSRHHELVPRLSHCRQCRMQVELAQTPCGRIAKTERVPQQLRRR